MIIHTTETFNFSLHIFLQATLTNGFVRKKIIDFNSFE